MLRYAQVECIKRSVVLGIYKHATNIRLNRKRLAQRPVPPLPNDLLPSGMRQKLFNLDQCVVGVMHTLILNLGKYVLLTAVRSLASDWSNYYENTNMLLIQVNKLSLSWCKCFHFGSKQNPGSMWVSENYLAFAFVSKSLFSFLHRLQSNKKLLRDVFWCYNTLISNVMQLNIPTNESCDKVGSNSKIFLSLYNLLDKGLPGDHESKIESASCIISVLTLEDQMRNKGMQRNYWEGGWFGEGFFRCVKPLIQRGVHTIGIFVSVLKKIYRIRSINDMIENDVSFVENGLSTSADNDETDLFDVSRYRRFHCYSKIDEILHAIQNVQPLAVFYHMPTKNFFVAITRNRTKWLIILNVNNFEIAFDTLLFNVTIEDVNGAQQIGEVSLKSIEYKSVLMLPICTGVDIVRYYAISDDHLEYDQNDEWKLADLHIESNIWEVLDNSTLSEELVNNLEIWNSDKKNSELVGQMVIPIENSTSGIITSCFL